MKRDKLKLHTLTLSFKIIGAININTQIGSKVNNNRVGSHYSTHLPTIINSIQDRNIRQQNNNNNKYVRK